MRRHASILLLLTWLALGTGVLAWLHDRQHGDADRGVATQHDENHCAIHAQLHSPAISGLPGAELVLAARCVETLVLPARSHMPAPDHAPDACRGPPVV